MGYTRDYPKILCPESCKFRNKLAPFCGYCLPAVMKKLGIRQEEKDGIRQNETENTGQAEG